MLRVSCIVLSLLLVSARVGLTAASVVESRQSGGRTSPLLTNFPGQPALPAISTITNANSTGAFLDLTNIQGDILVGMKKPVEHFYFFKITNPWAFKIAMKYTVLPLVTSAATLVSPPKNQPAAYLNVAFSQSGLKALGVNDNLGDPEFAAGQFADAANLGDQTSTWNQAFKGTSIHGVFLVGSDATTNIAQTYALATAALSTCVQIVYSLEGAARPGAMAGHEHFGYLDGISQPGVTGFTTNAFPGQSMVPTGVILAGRDGDSVTRPSWALDGSFLAFRKLQQLVPEYNKFLLDNALQNNAGTLTRQQGADLLGARLIGRWKSGAPVDLAPTADDPALGADPTRNNNFDFSDASDQSRCPFSAHIRKTRPRSDLGNTNVLNQAIRAGIPYGPEVTAAEAASNKTTVDRGLAFVMYQSTIGNGFSFQQRIWANNQNFIFGKPNPPGLDPIIGQNAGAARTFVGQDPLNQTRPFTEQQTVVSNGGEYFFSPSISALRNTILAF